MSLRFDLPIRRIAVLRALALGDLLCATPALRALRERFPDAEITLIGLPWSADLVRRLGSVDRFVPFPGWPGIRERTIDHSALNALLTESRGNPYDLAMQMHGSGEVSNGFVAALGAANTVGFQTGGDPRISLTARWIEDEHETLRWLRLVGLLGATSPSCAPEFPLCEADRHEAGRLVATLADGAGPLVGIHAGASDPARRWPVERFAAVADRLVDDFGARIVLTGGPSERNLVADLTSRMRHPVLDLAGQTDLGGFAAVVDRLDLLLTNDTGASHLAAARQTPSVVLFGPSRPERWAPLNHRLHRVVDARAYGPIDRTGADALAALPVGPVLDACADALLAAHRPETTVCPGLAATVGQEQGWTA